MNQRDLLRALEAWGARPAANSEWMEASRIMRLAAAEIRRLETMLDRIQDGRYQRILGAETEAGL